MAPKRKEADRVAAEQARAMLLKQSKRFGVRPDEIPSETRAIIDCFLVKTHAFLPMGQQAAALGLPLNGIKRRRQRLYAEGRIHVSERKSHPVIAPHERVAVLRLRTSGMSAQTIARMRGIPLRRVERILTEAGPIQREPTITASDLKRIFGISETVVRRWIGRGWLEPGKDNGGSRNTQHRWRRADLFAFVRVREAWVSWEVNQIAVPELRAFADLTRRAASGRWWATKEIAYYLGVPTQTFFTYVSRDRYLSDVETIVYHARFFWLTGNPPPLTSRAVAAD